MKALCADVRAGAAAAHPAGGAARARPTPCSCGCAGCRSRCPWHAAFVERSPYTVHLTDGGADLYRGEEFVSPVKLPRRPRIYDMETADGIPYSKIALLHLDSIASTVVQKCIYWGTDEQCGFCGIELTRGEQTIPVKTPAQLAEVCTAARDYDGAVDVTLTTGSINRRDRGALYISRCAAAIKDASGLPIQVQFEPPDDLAVLGQVRDAGVDAVGIHIETFDPEVLRASGEARHQLQLESHYGQGEHLQFHPPGHLCHIDHP